MALGVLTLYLYIPGCSSLKEKRHRIKPLLSRLHKEFNVSAAEIDQQDIWQNTTIVCAYISNHSRNTQIKLDSIKKWVETTWPDVTVMNDFIELFQ